MNLSDRVALDGSSRSRSRWTGGTQRFGTSGNIPHGLIGETNCSCVAIHGCLLPQTDPRIALLGRWPVFGSKPPSSELNIASRCPLSRILPLWQIVLAIAEFRSQEGEMISAHAFPNLLELPRARYFRVVGSPLYSNSVSRSRTTASFRMHSFYNCQKSSPSMLMYGLELIEFILRRQPVAGTTFAGFGQSVSPRTKIVLVLIFIGQRRLQSNKLSAMSSVA